MSTSEFLGVLSVLAHVVCRLAGVLATCQIILKTPILRTDDPSSQHRSSLDRYWLSTAEGNGHIDALSTTLTDFGRHTRYASAQASELKDADTAAIFTEIARGIDKWLWFVQTSQQAGSRAGRDFI